LKDVPLPSSLYTQTKPAALLDDAVYGGQAKTRAFSFFLGSKERLEDVRLGFFVHAGCRYR